VLGSTKEIDQGIRFQQYGLVNAISVSKVTTAFLEVLKVTVGSLATIKGKFVTASRC
jgi:hypothetical protein